MRAAIRAGAVLADRHRLADDLHLLNDAVLAGQPLEPASAVRTTIQFIIASSINLVGRKGRSFMARMPQLTADPPLLPAKGRRGLGWLHDITRRRLGGIRRILAKPGHLGFQGHYTLPQLHDDRDKLFFGKLQKRRHARYYRASARHGMKKLDQKGVNGYICGSFIALLL